MLDLRPAWARRGFAAQLYASVTNEVNRQIAELRKQGLEPVLVRLGPVASTCYAYEQWAKQGRVELAPAVHRGHRCEVPIRYRDGSISGVVVEGRMR